MTSRRFGLSIKSMETMTQNTVITWKTTKNADGKFVATVYAFGYEVPSVTLGTYTRATREQAVSAAKQATRYFNANRNNQAAR